MTSTLKVDEIKKMLTDAGISFDEKMKRDDLLRLLDEANQNDATPPEETDQAEEPKKKYVVVHDFKDLKDGNTIYIKGDIYPRRADAVVEEDRIKELSSTKNNIGKVLIKEQD
ncbi:hypothetical protein M4D71_00695 [Niallia taxi]|uniref:hypothetical protein n=1 Tax=Niallia taxi TaxID=2499688 RepID=UPI0021A61C3A|nr:hypothetical protein [Niallia taxi]MCT2342637.1 hypothetical protein [Niallia taxi]